MAIDLQRPPTHRGETVREQNLRVELAELRRDVAFATDAIAARLDRLVPAAIEIGPEALQLVVGARRLTAGLRLRVGE